MPLKIRTNVRIYYNRIDGIFLGKFFRDKGIDFVLATGFCCDGAVKHDYEVVLDKNAEEDDVVEITVEDTYDQTLVITMTVVEPETKELTKLDSKGKVYFDDEEMKKAAERFIDEKFDDLAKSDVDTDYDVWTNANGYIIKLDEASESDDGYFLVLGVEDGKKSSIASRSTKATLDVMFTDGKTAELDVAFDADGGDLGNYYDKDTYEFFEYDEAEGDYIVGGVFKYALNDDGDIEKIVDCEDVWSDGYEFDAKYDELEYFGGNQRANTVKFTGKDFVFVVDKDYVEYIDRDGYTWQETVRVDKDLVLCLTIDDLKDIDREDTAKAKYGRYDDDYGAIAGLKEKNQNGVSADYADGALLVVDDIDEYTGTRTHVVGAITDISVNSKGVYTFEMDDGDKYSTGKTDKDKTLYADGFDISAADDEIVENIAVKPNTIKDYGYVLYADLTLRNDEVVGVTLLVEQNADGRMQPKANPDSDYRVVRGIIDRVADDEIRVIGMADYRMLIAASDETIYTIDEYMDASLKATYELNDDTVVYATNEIPGLTKEVPLILNIAYDKDFEITKDGKLEESIFRSAEKTDTYFVVDLIIDVDDKDKPVVAAYTFDDVEDEKPEATSETSIEAACDRTAHGSKIAVEIFRTVKAFGQDAETAAIPVAELKAIPDAKFHVTIERPHQNPDTVGDPYEPEKIELTIDNVSFEGGKAIINLSAETPVVALDKVTVTVDGYGVDTYVDQCVA